MITKLLNFSIGFELEFFIYNSNNQLQNASECYISHDDNPIVGEIRSEHHNDIFKAVNSLLFEKEKVKRQLASEFTMVLVDWIKKDKRYDALIEEIKRKQGMNKQIAWQSLYGYEPSAKNKTHQSAGLHITIGDNFSLPSTCKCGRTISQQRQTHLDFPFWFKKIEKEFGKEISKSGRTKGFYEVKGNGLTEYRSLPASLINDSYFAERLHYCLTVA